MANMQKSIEGMEDKEVIIQKAGQRWGEAKRDNIRKRKSPGDPIHD